jgi:HPt (histidine-containing phosphotransfer) domain-containing protein
MTNGAILDPAAIQALRELAGKPGVGTSVITELVETYLTGALERCVEIEAASGAGDLDEVRRQAHALAGASGCVGALEVMSCCRELEAKAERGDVDGIALLAAGLGEAVGEARAALQAEFAG